jgi:hypothetical protein
MLESPLDSFQPSGQDACLSRTHGLSSTSSCADSPRYHTAENASHTLAGRTQAAKALAAHQLQVLLAAGDPEAIRAAPEWRPVGPAK